MLLLVACIIHSSVTTKTFLCTTHGFEIYNTENDITSIDETEILEFYERETVDEVDMRQFYSVGSSHKKDSEPTASATSSSSAGNYVTLGNSHKKDNDSNFDKDKEDISDQGININGNEEKNRGSGLKLGSVQTFSSASGFASYGSSSSSTSNINAPINTNNNCPPVTCDRVDTYDLLPVLPNCHEYILCQHSQLTLTFSCGEGLRFDNVRKRCEAEDEVECACVTTEPEAESGSTSTTSEVESTGKETIDMDKSSTMNANLPQAQVSENEASSICTSIKRSQLLPLESMGCKEYVSCLNGRMIARQSCAEGLLFDVDIQGCNWKDVVDCPEYDDGTSDGDEKNGVTNNGDEAAKNEPSNGGSSLGYFDIGNLDFGDDDKNDDDDDDDDNFQFGNGDNGFLIVEPEEDYNNNNNIITVSPEDADKIDTFQTVTGLVQTILQIAEAEAEEICSNQEAYAILPLELTGCKYYASCTEREVALVQECGENLLFDINIIGCNWATSVDCPTMSPTTSPVNAPTRRPTNRPTRRVTPSPTERPTNRPTRRQTRRPTERPTERRTSRPTKRPTDVPTPRPTPRQNVLMPDQNEQPSSGQNNGQPSTLSNGQPSAGQSTQTAPPPDTFDWLQNHRRELNQNVFQSYTKDGTKYRSYWFQYQDFYQALELMSGNSNNNDKGVTGLEKHLFYLGDEPQEWEYGLVNIAAFLAHAMTESITNDACDEYHWERNTDGSSSEETGGSENHYAISNACGQGGMNYQEFTCPAGEEHMHCTADRNIILQATTSDVYPNAPPPLSCRPRTTGESYTGYWDVGQGKELSFFPYENSYGRTDVEGCCYWGRGAIHSKGICNLGKINYYLGKKAADEGRQSRYPTTDFCLFPEAICAAPESREMRWVTSMFEWAERVQSYDDMQGWNYKRKLKEFVDHGLIDFEFLDATSGILTNGCHDPPCYGSGPKKHGGWGSGEDIHLAEERVENFKTILIALEAGGEDALLRGLIKYFTDRTDIMNSQILRSQTPQGQLYPSYRYQLPDYLAALTYISDTGVGEGKFYTGEARVPEGVRYGIVNAVMFLAQAYKEAIQYDACDENNWQLVNDRFPLSNSCGQLGMSYQDMHCREDEAYMECPVKRDMEQVALTSALWFQAPAPFKCGPRSKYPTTGFWDYDVGRENNDDAYSNSRGRVDVEGCCWWGRGIIQTRGTCNYGKLNYHLGKRASDEGRTALYPGIDFCEFPQGVCSSDETYGGELQWMVGFFEWADRIQTYDVDGWNYIEKLKEFTDGGYKDFSFVDAVSGILNIGCHDPPCMGFGASVVQPHNKRDRNDTFQRFLNQLQVARNFRPPPKPTPMPSPNPTDDPTPGVPTTDMPTVLDPPTEAPTLTHMPTGLQGRPPENAVQEVENKVQDSKARFAELLLMSEHPSGELWPSYLYTWDGFQKALKKMTTGVGPGEKNFFYIGDGYSPKSLEYGLVNIAAFLAEGISKSIYYDACDENSYEMVDFRYPISNSCGQEGQSYEDDKCDADDKDEAGMECEVDPKMEINAVTHAKWVGAPPPLYCGDRNVGYWDHITGLEQHDPPFKNKNGRSDIKGCCWWGRGVMQVKGVCTYGKLNHWLGAKAASENRPSIYPDIDFCKNPGIICSDSKRSHELRWTTGMFHWVQTVQRCRECDYFPKLKAFVDQGDYTDGSFIGMINALLGGNTQAISRRTKTFFYAMRAFNLISIETNSTGTPVHTYCGVDFRDAGSKCSPCESNFDCTGMELCYADVVACVYPPTTTPTPAPVGLAVGAMGNNTTQSVNTNDLASDDAPAEVAMLMSSLAVTTNYCGESWGDAVAKCANPCPSGTDTECAPGHYCFGDITTCSKSNHIANSNNNGIVANDNAFSTNTKYCGVDWSDAQSKCLSTCFGGMDSECPLNQKCFGDIHC